MLKPFITLLGLVTFFLCSPSSYALGKLGHQLVCQLSFDLLPPEKQHQLEQILASLPATDVESINRYNNRPADATIDFGLACTWADAIKRDERFNLYKSWHYINVPRDQTEITAQSCQQNCVTSAIIHHAKQLTLAQTSDERRVAMMFLGHWLGDLHQPLHVAFASDQGGNKTPITPYRGNCTNLHWYWDQCLLYREGISTNEVLLAALYQELSAQMTDMHITQWDSAQVYQWANESIALVRENQLGYCQIKEQQCQITTNLPLEISPQYHQQYQQALLNKIKDAAQRLASVLTQSL